MATKDGKTWKSLGQFLKLYVYSYLKSCGLDFFGVINRSGELVLGIFGNLAFGSPIMVESNQTCEF